MKCPSGEEIALYLEGEATHARTLELEPHVRVCRDCADEIESTRDLLCQLAAGVDGVDFIPAIRTGLQRSRSAPSSEAGPWIIGLGTIVASALLVVVSLSLAPNEEMRSKGKGFSADDRLGITAYRMGAGNGDAVPLAGWMARGDSLAFSYSRIGVDDHDYLMVLAIDAAGEIHWYYPAYVTAGTNPRSVRLERPSGDLPDQVSHELAAGPATLRAIFSKLPLTVMDVETLAQRRDATSPLPIADTVQRAIEIEVR